MCSLQTILFLGSNPGDTVRLRLDEEFHSINNELRLSRERDRFRLEQKWAVRPRDIQSAMANLNPQIVHFSGHGDGEAGLVFVDNNGNSQLVDSAALASLFMLFADKLHCVVLNGCYSEVQAKTISQHISYVIGMNQAISNDTAIAFARGFYLALGAGRDVEFAFNMGCNAIQIEGLEEHLAPVLLKKPSTTNQPINDASPMPDPTMKGTAEDLTPVLPKQPSTTNQPTNDVPAMPASTMWETLYKNRLNFILLKSIVLVVFSVLVGMIGIILYIKNDELKQADSLNSSSKLSLEQGEHINALIDGIKAGKILQRQRTSSLSVLTALQTALDKKKEFNRLESHTDTVRSVSFSSDGLFVASGGNDKMVKIWDGVGKKLHDLSGHRGAVTSVSFHPKEKILVTGSEDKTIKIWAVTGGLIQTLSEKNLSDVRSVKFSPNGKMLVAAGKEVTKNGKANGIVMIWKQAESCEVKSCEWKLFKKLDVKGDSAWSVDFNNSSTKLVSSSSMGSSLDSANSTIEIWDPNTGKNLKSISIPKTSMFSVVFNPQKENILAASGADKVIRIWDLTTEEKPIELQGHNKFIYSMAYSPDGQTIASASLDGTIKIWKSEKDEKDKDKWGLVDTLNGSNGELYSVNFAKESDPMLLKSEAKNTLVLASGGAEKTVKIWHLKGDMRHKFFVGSLAFSHDSERLLSGSAGEKKVKLWDVKNRKEINAIDASGKEVTNLAFNPKDNMAFAIRNVDKNENIQIYKLDTNDEIAKSYFITDENNIDRPPTYPMSYSLNGEQIASGSGNQTIKIWNAKEKPVKQQTPIELEKQLGHILDVKYGKNILASSNNYGKDEEEKQPDLGERNIIKIWDAQAGRVTFSLPGHEKPVNSLSFNPQNYNLLASGSRDSTVKIWDLAQKKSIFTSDKQDGPVRRVTFSHNGKFLAGSTETGRINIWDVEKQKKVYDIKASNQAIIGLDFSPNGKVLASGGNDSYIKLWNNVWSSDSDSLDSLINDSCQWVASYLENNPNVKSENKDICKGSSKQR